MDNITVYSSIAGAGKTTLANELSLSTDVEIVSLDPQDGGCIDNAKSAQNSVLDCAPYLEFAEEAAKYSKKLIYILRPVSFKLPRNPVIYVKILMDEVAKLKSINSDLEIEFMLSKVDKWSGDVKEIASEVIKSTQ